MLACIGSCCLYGNVKSYDFILSSFILSWWFWFLLKLCWQLEECFVCSDKKPNVLFKPCNHICVCSDCAKVMKKCAQCRKPIEETVSYADLCGANYSRNIEISNVAANDSNVASGQVNQLTQELTAMKEQMMCPICMDNRRNMVFLCGHGTCKDCGNRIRECPMCRKAIEKRVLLFQWSSSCDWL